MKKLLLAGVLLAGAAGVASADGISISIGDGQRHRDYDQPSYNHYDHARDYHHHRTYYYRGGYFRNGEWVPRERFEN